LFLNGRFLKIFSSETTLPNDRDEISNLYRGPSIDASYQVLVQLAKQFQGRRFLEIDQSETRIVCGSQAILVSDWLISKKSSPLKPLSQMN
jgi:hypothetical protein